MPPDYLSTLTGRELQGLMREASSLPLTALLNTGAVAVDYEGHRIWRDSFWKGSFAKNTPMGIEERILTPVRRNPPYYTGGRFWKRFDAIEGDRLRGWIVNYGMAFLPGKPVVQQLRYPDDTRSYARRGDDVLLLTYTNQPYKIVYDLIKCVDANNCIGVMHLGTFPRGLVFASFVMARNNYPFEKMAAPDHDQIFTGDHARAPSAADIAGAWRGYLVLHKHPETALHNQFNPPVMRVTFRTSGNGTEARMRTGLFSTTRTAEFGSDRLTLTGSSQIDQIRLLDRHTLIGRRVSQGLAAPRLRYVLTRAS